MKFAIALAVAQAAAVIATPAAEAKSSKPTFYLIRHAEKNKDGTISAQGKKRAQCLINVFSRDSDYNIQHIMVQTPHQGSNLSQRPYNTTLPLANSLGITMDTPCDYDDTDCAGNYALGYTGGNVLIGWEHVMLRHVAEAIGASNVPKYPDDRFDLIYKLPPPYTKVTSVTSEGCPGLDN